MNISKLGFFSFILAGTLLGQEVVNGLVFKSGNLPLKENTKFNLSLTSDELLFTQGKQVVSVPSASIGSILHGHNAQGRSAGTNAAIATAAVALPPVSLLMLRKKKKTHYVGLTWTDASTRGEGGVMFQVGSEKQKRKVLELLQRRTGKDVIDTDKAMKGN